jgi:two-component system, LuxR family, response regulator FixJ
VDAALLVAIVDDDSSVRNALGALVSAMGYRQMSFPSAQALLQILEKEQVACVITDLQMPEIDGIALKALLDLRQPDLPVIMITARDDKDLRDRAREAGAKALLRKPFRAQDLEQALADALRDRHV